MNLLGISLDPIDPQLREKLKAEMDALGPDALDALYDQLDGSHQGTYYGTDIAKGMFHEAFTRSEMNVATGPLARQYVTDRFKRDLQREKHPTKLVVIFTAGGPGSGKSESILQGLVDVGDALVFDSTLTNLDQAKDLINAALAADLGVNIAYVHRRVEDAMEFAIQRFDLKGMYVDPARLGRDHYLAQRNLLILNEFFHDAIDLGRMEINVFLNLGCLAEFHQIETGVDFFLNPLTPTDRYDDEAATIARAVLADGGRMAQAYAARKAAKDPRSVR